MTPESIGDLLHHALMTIFEMSAPMLVAGLVVGVLISLFQAATQLQEVTLVFIPKMLAVGLALWFAGPWIMDALMLLFTEVMTRMPGAPGAP